MSSTANTGNSAYSAAPGTPQTPTKAVNGASVAGIVTAIITWAVSYLTGHNDSDTNTLLAAVGAGIGNAALTYITVFVSKNKAKYTNP